ncbi:MAG: hypothetical protein ABI644_10850 [Arenimonas sp.]
MTAFTRDFFSYASALTARIALVSAIATLLCVFEFANKRTDTCCR